MMTTFTELWIDPGFRLFAWMSLTGIFGYILIFFNEFLDDGNPCKHQTQVKIIGNIIFTIGLVYSLVKMIIEFINLIC